MSGFHGQRRGVEVFAFMTDNPLSQFGDAIRDRWLDAIWASYPEESLRLLRDNPDRFANPVGTVYRRSTEGVVKGLLGDCAVEDLAEYLEPMVRVRAVQEMQPSKAVSHILRLKELARAQVAAAGSTAGFAEALASFEIRVDQLLFVAFDLYMTCREEVFSIRVKEIRNRSLKVMERLNEWRERRVSSPPGPVGDAE